MFKWKKKKEALKANQVSAILGEGTEFEGRLTFHGLVHLDGKFKGEIQALDTLVVGETGQVEARISADVVVISGTVTGQIEAKNRLELHRPGILNGDVRTKSLVVTEGAIFNGTCFMTEDRKEPQTLTLIGKKAGRGEEREKRE